jgi:hypothetical protein
MGDLLRFDPIARRVGTEPARRKLDELLEADDGRARIRALDSVYLFGLLREVGLDDALPLLHEVSGEQAQALLDLDCWQGDEVSIERLEGWLAAHMQGGADHVEELHRHLDPELLGLLFKEKLRIYFYEDEDDAELIDHIQGPLESSPDGVYAIEMPDDAAEADFLRALLRQLYASDQDGTRQLLHHARWDLASQLQETAYQMRSGRLEQEGFLPPEEAVEIYAPVKPPRERAQAEHDLAAGAEPLALLVAEPVAVPVALADDLLHVTDMEAGTFAGCALRRAADKAGDLSRADQLLRQLQTLVNRVVVVERGRPGDPDDMRAAFARVHAMLNLGLQYLAERDPERAAALVEHWPLKRVFRTGFSLTASLANQARGLVEQGQLSLAEELPYSLCTAAEAELLEGLLESRPVRSLDEGLAFSTLDEVEAAATELAVLAYKVVWTFSLSGLTRDTLVDHLGQPGAGVLFEDVSFDALLATRAALAVLGERGWRLLGLDEVAWLVREHLPGGAPSDALATALATVAQPPHPAERSAGPMAARWVADMRTQLAEHYGGLTPEAFAAPELLPALWLWREDPVER